MALTKNARNKLFKLVQQSKKLLYQEITEQLQQHYGIFADSGKVVLVEELTTSEADVIHKAKLLRDRLKYLASNLADKKNEAIESIEQLIREQAFTILNRLAALRMAEERGIVRETISNGYTSEGFQVYDSITGQGGITSTYIRYKWYLNAVFDELALDLPSIFDRFSPYAIIFPGERSLLEMLNLINDEELITHREEGFSAINLWQQDETIGWIYQYYNGRDEIKAMRDASDAPRNSRELAVRNQFFTPRYVVQFLTDNSLGKIWYEMTKGNTSLKDTCPYLIKHPKELFLDKGENTPLKSESDVQYIDYREIKDPREIKMLDPACGSMHFGLYAFDLMEIIYQEAWDNHQELLTDLKISMTRADYMNQIPEFIIRYNIHGVDIDPRALQIAALSLWLRAQKSFDKLKIEPSKRPQIKKSNLVLAEPMPVNQEFLSELVKPLDAPMRKLVLEIWDLMKLAGETGLLLRIEHEIDKQIQEIAKGLSGESKNSQITIGANDEQLIAAEQSALYATKKYRVEFLDNAEKQVLEILKSLAENADNGNAYQKLLFADDSARGFAFIELCRQSYDVIVMNPPFGDASVNTESYLQKNYPEWGKNILAAFFDRTLELINSNGLVGAIFDRTVSIKSSYEDFRVKCFCGHITTLADTGWNVLDANVETMSLVLKKQEDNFKGVYISLYDVESKDNFLLKSIIDFNKSEISNKISIRDSSLFTLLPNKIIGYYFDDFLINYFKHPRFQDFFNGCKQGHALNSGKHFRLYYEVKNHGIYKHLYNGSSYRSFYLPYREITYFVNDGDFIRQDKSLRYSSGELQLKRGIAWGKRGEMMSAQILKPNFVFTVEGNSMPDIPDDFAITCLSYLNSILSQYVINSFCGLHKYSGYVNLLPIPFKATTDYKHIIDVSKEIITIKRFYFAFDETCLEFQLSLIKHCANLSIKEAIIAIQNKLIEDKKRFDFLVDFNDNFWLEAAKATDKTREVVLDCRSKRPNENLISIDGLADNQLNENQIISFEILSNIIGVVFGRWEYNIKKAYDFADIFDSLPFKPQVYLEEVPENYEINIPKIGILVEDSNSVNSIFKFINDSIYKIWGSKGDIAINELCEIGQFRTIEDFISQPNGFFDYHYKRYTKSRREAPIYWPLSSSSGNYTIWLYYSKLNDQTLISIINNYLQPKIDEVVETIRQMSNNVNLDNKGLKELKFLQDFEHELEDMKKEIKSVASLPYKPNHDDGVLITAAPLYKLFRHAKWRKSTEECWKSLEIGEYDWAHLAYSIWPERVAKKCKKDYSMAIAHGLENICENKPKEKKEKVKKVPKETKKNLKLNLE